MFTWGCETLIVAGEGAAQVVIQSAASRGPVVTFVDSALVDQPAIALLVDAGRRTGSVVEVAVDDDSIDRLLATFDSLGSTGCSTVISIGGGSVGDAAKMFRAFRTDPDSMIHAVTRPGRSGFLEMPESDPSDRPALLVLPTTLGTGVEVSPIACVRRFASSPKRIARGAVLQPSKAVLDPLLTETLPHHLVVDGIVEVILRFLGPFLAAPSAARLADRSALNDLCALVEFSARADSMTFTAADRLEIALLGANTRIGPSLIGRDAFGSRLWYLATTLSDVAGISKVDANLAVLPVLLDRIAGGDRRFGDPEQLEACRRALGIEGFASGREIVTALVGKRPEPMPISIDVDDAAERAMSSWGRGLPMLAGLNDLDIASLFADVVVSGRVAIDA